MDNHILVVGSNNMDLTIHTPRLPVLGETLMGSGFATVPGGKGANQAVAAARLGAQVKMAGCVGEDLFGTALLDNLRDSGVDPVAVRRLGPNSGIAMITVCGGDNHILLDPGANARVTPAMIEEERALFRWADMVLLQFELPMDVVLCAARLAKEEGAQVVLNPAPMTTIDPALLACTDWFIPNRSEAARLLDSAIDGMADAAAAVEALHARGISQVIITLGADGCLYNAGTAIRHRAAHTVTAVDTTAAGDAFIGGLCARVARGADLDEAIAYATAVSALTVGRRGASSSLPYEDEVEGFRLEHGDPAIETVRA